MIETNTIPINPFFLPEAEQFNLHGIAQVEEGKVSRIKFKALQKKIEVPEIEEIPKIKPTLDNIAKVVCEHYQISINHLKGKSRKGDTMKARRLFFAIAKIRSKITLRIIGEFVNRNHCTVISACHSIEGYEYKKDDITWELFQTLKRKFELNN